MPTFCRSCLATSTAPVLLKSSCRVTTYGRSGWGAGCCGFGYGGAVVKNPKAMAYDGSVGEFFWGGVANTKFWVDFQRQIVGVIMTQRLGGLTPTDGGVIPVHVEIKKIVYRSLTGTP